MGAEGLNKETHKAHYSIFPEDFENDNGGTEHDITEPLDHGEQIEMFEGENLGNAPIERSEPVSFEASKSEGSWREFGDNVIPIREGGTIPTENPSAEVANNPTETLRDESEIDLLNPTKEEMAARPINIPVTFGEKVKSGLDNIGENFKQRFESVKGFLSKNNLDKLDRLTEHGKRIAVEVFGKASEMTGLDRLSAKTRILWNEHWSKEHKKELDKITAKSNKEVEALRTEIDILTKNREGSSADLAAMSELSPRHAAIFQAEIDRQDLQIAEFSKELAAATERQLESIRKQQEKVTNSENAALEIGAKYTIKVEARMAPINKLESAAKNALSAFDEKYKEQAKTLNLQLESIANEQGKLRRMQEIRSRIPTSDTETLRVIDQAIAEDMHTIEHALELIEQTKLHAEQHRRVLEKRIESQTKRKQPYEEKMAFFKDRREAVIKRRSSSLNTTTPEGIKPLEADDADAMLLDNVVPPDVTNESAPEAQDGINNEVNFVEDTEASEVMSMNFIKAAQSWNEYIATEVTGKKERDLLTVNIKDLEKNPRIGGEYSINKIPDILAGLLRQTMNKDGRLDKRKIDAMIEPVVEEFAETLKLSGQ